VAMIPIAAPNFYANFPDWAQIILKSGITFGSIMAILLNLLLNGVNKGDEIKEMGRR
ncbi:MAG: purine permease, partial [Veillonella sp.]|nr:purine permease [Veillonella sp.]MDU8009163.1 purine permease [Veillonella sp.]